jgi:hypothetical protein
MVCSSCTVPLTPGFAVQRQALALSYVPVKSERAHIRVTYRLQNLGNQDLRVLQAVLPAPLDLQIRVDGRAITPETSDALRRGSVLISVPFEPAWPQKGFRDLEMEYDLALDESSQTAAHPIRYEQAAEWFPELRKPRGSFSKGLSRAREVSVTIQVPQGFNALASGQNLGIKIHQGESEYRFRLRDADYEPFVVIGHYQEKEIRTPSGTVVFWTLEPLTDPNVRAAAERIAATVQTYENYFGRRDRKRLPVWIVETSPLPGPGGPQGPAATSFPSTALLNQAAFAEGVNSPVFQALAAEQLARTWFGWLIVPSRNLPPDRNIGQSLARYAAIAAAQASNGDAERRLRAAQLLRQFDERRKRVADKPLLQAEFRDSPDQQEMAVVKGTMFLLALEDAYGAEPLRRGLAHLVRALRGRDFGLATLRAAFEQETHKEMADVFRIWLDHTGIPADFRARYGSKTSSGN